MCIQTVTASMNYLALKPIESEFSPIRSSYYFQSTVPTPDVFSRFRLTLSFQMRPREVIYVFRSAVAVSASMLQTCLHGVMLRTFEQQFGLSFITSSARDEY